jgi:hypothetical protein
VSVYTAKEGYRLWRRWNYLRVAGVALLILGAIGVPIALALFAT